MYWNGNTLSLWRFKYKFGLATKWGLYYTIICRTFWDVCCFGVECNHMLLFTNALIKCFLNHDGFHCCWDVYVHCYSFWPKHLGFLKLCCFVLQLTPPWMSLLLDLVSEYLIDYAIFGTLYFLFKFFIQMLSVGVPGFETNGPFRCLVPWIFLLPPVCRSTFWKSRLKW